MLSETNKEKARLIAQGVPVCKVAKFFNVSHQSVYKLMKLNEEFVRLIFWEANQKQIKRRCKYLAYHYKFEYDELYSVAYIEVLESKSLLTAKKQLRYLTGRIAKYCRKEIKYRNEQQTIDFTNPLNEDFLNDCEGKFFK